MIFIALAIGIITGIILAITGYSSGEKAGYFGTDDDILRHDHQT